MPNDALGAASRAGFAYAFAAPPGSARPIMVRSDYAIEPHLPLFLLGWPFRRVSDDQAADISLRHAGNGVVVFIADRHEKQLDAMSEFDGINRLADSLSHIAAARADDVAELHASAVLIGARLALFVGPSLSGKTSLALQLAARGHRLFTDDRLLVGPLGHRQAAPYGMALGLTPRVRQPPHPAAGVQFAQFVARHVVKGSGEIGFLPLPAGVAAAFGETAPIGALILPERCDAGGIVLRPAGEAAAGRAMLEQMHAPKIAATDFLAAIRRLTAGLPAWHLQYDDSAKAALQVRDMMAG